jgi:hypothetical protein
MRQAWKQACDRAVAVFGISMLDQPRPTKLPSALKPSARSLAPRSVGATGATKHFPFVGRFLSMTQLNH